MNFREKLCSIIEGKEESYIFDCDLYDYIKNILIPNKSVIPTLYRYSPADYNNIRNLETEKLFLSEIGSMNDIFEGLSCEIDDKVIENLEKLHDIAYVKSFSENKDDLLMWSLYADNYSGMCVEYDLTNMQDKYYYHLFPVVYSTKRQVKSNLNFTFDELTKVKQAYENNDALDEIEFLKDIMGLFISKSECWKYEKEWRMIVTYLQMNEGFDYIKDNDDEKREFYNIDSQNIEFPYAKKIYLGPKMRQDIKDHLFDIGEKLGTPVIETKLSRNEYKLEYDENKG